MRGSAAGQAARVWVRKTSGLLAASALAAAGLVGIAAQTPSAAAGCMSMHVVGKAATGRQALKRHDIAVFLHDHDRALGGGRTDSHGGFNIKVCRSATLKKYANRHDGRINFDVLTHRHGNGGSWYMRAATARYSSSKVPAGRGFVAAQVVDRTLSARTARGGGTYATGVAATGATVASPPLMFVQAVRHMTVDYKITSSTVEGIKAVIGAEGGSYKAAGEIAIESTSGFESLRTIKATKKRPEVARLIKPELAITSQYTCYTYNSYFGSYLGSGKCVTESSGKWTGPVHTEQTSFRGCHSAGSNVSTFTNRHQKEIATTAGVTYSSKMSLGALGSSLEVTAKYGSGTEVRLKFDQGGRKHKFCVGGNEGYVSESAELYVNSLDYHQDGPCGRRDTRCRSAS
jgi:hypothetical protein